MKFKMLALATASLVAIATPLGAAKPVYGDWGYNAAAMDSSVKPGDDFWAYVNGNWDKTTKIAPDRDHLGQQVGDFYSSFVDTGAIDTAGTAPLKPYLAEINGAKTRAQLLS